MNFYNTKITDNFQIDLREKLISSGFVLSCAQNALWKATSEGVVVTCYSSLKLLVQGKNTESFVNKYLDLKENSQTIQPKLSDVAEVFSHDFDCWIGTDESGKGDYFGPLVTAGVLVKKEQVEFLSSLNIKDSKKLTDKLILEIAPKIKQNCIFSVITINPEKYNELYSKFKNLNRLLAWAHSRAIENVLEKEPNCNNAISDKFADESLIKNALFKNGKKINLIQRTKAESDIAVACASILAREEFVLKMKKFSSIYKMDFAKGGGENPTNQAKEFVQKYGRENLNKIAKLHFKNTQKAINV